MISITDTVQLAHNKQTTQHYQKTMHHTTHAQYSKNGTLEAVACEGGVPSHIRNVCAQHNAHRRGRRKYNERPHPVALRYTGLQEVHADGQCCKALVRRNAQQRAPRACDSLLRPVVVKRELQLGETGCRGSNSIMSGGGGGSGTQTSPTQATKRSTHLGGRACLPQPSCISAVALFIQ